MKPLKQYVNITNESLLDDEDVLSDPKRDKLIIENWIRENYVIKGTLKISGDFMVSCKGSVVVKNKDISSLTNGMFHWDEIGGEFSCYNCENLKSLEGGPKWVGWDFKCTGCVDLRSLEGAPEGVGGDFSCYGCNKLTSLEGAPKEVGGSFHCAGCKNLKTLEGAPEKINWNFSCVSCKNLKSLKGAPKYVKNDFYCYSCPDLVITDSDREKYNIKS